MPQTITCPRQSRERILIYGTGGAGKSESVMAIARAIQGAGNSVFVLDNDADWARSLDMNEDVGNVVLYEVPAMDYEGALELVRKTKREAKPDDWVALDSFSPFWEASQNEFTERMWGKDLTELFVSYRKNMAADAKNVQPMDGWKDWPVIKRLLGEITQAILELPCHVIMTGQSKAVNSEIDKGDMLRLFEPLGAKPVGNKEVICHLPFTIVHTKAMGRGVHEMSTAKDKGRALFEDEVYEDFALDYLVGHAGWEIADERETHVSPPPPPAAPARKRSKATTPPSAPTPAEAAPKRRRRGAEVAS